MGAAAVLGLAAPTPHLSAQSAEPEGDWSRVESAEQTLWICNVDSVHSRDLIPVLMMISDRVIEISSKTDLDQRIEFEPGIAYTTGDLWRVLNRSLAEQAMTTVLSPDTDAIRIVLREEAPSAARLERQAEAPFPVGYRRVLLEAEHAKVESLAAAAKLLLPQNVGTVSELRESGRLLLTGQTAQLAEAIDVVTSLDAPGDPPTIQVFPTYYLSAIDLKAKLESLVPLYQ